MRLRTCRYLLIAALLVSLTGCPAASISPGTWIIVMKVSGQDSVARGIDLLANGHAQSPNPIPAAADEGWAGTTTWDQSGSTFTMVQLLGQNQFFTGTVHSSTSMSGTWSLSSFSDPPIGSWAAVWLP